MKRARPAPAPPAAAAARDFSAVDRRGAALLSLESPGAPEAPEDAKTLEQGRALAAMAWEFRDEADRALASLVTDWPTHRQPVVDRNVLRLAFYEMLHGGVPHAAAIDQAVELAREFGGERSPAFVNAVLDRWWKNRGEAN
jgi:N utilization substance protein B